MAWTVNEVSRDRAEKARDQRNQSRFFQIQADNDNETPTTALSATGLPTVNDVHPSDAFSVADRVVITRDQRNKRVFDAEVIYTTQPGPEPPDVIDDPFAQPTEEYWSTLYVQREVTHDINNRLIANSAGDLYEGVTVDDIIQVVRFTRNEPEYSAQFASQYINKINLDTFHGADPGRARIHDITSNKIPYVQNGVINYYWRTTYEIHLKDMIILDMQEPLQPGLEIKGWQLRLADAGLYYDSGEVHARIKDDDGKPIVTPWPLNGGGLVLEGQPVGVVYWNVFDIHRSVNFSPLGL